MLVSDQVPGLHSLNVHNFLNPVCHRTMAKLSNSSRYLSKKLKILGRLGVVSWFQPEDPKSSDALAQKGQPPFEWGFFLFKGQRRGIGQPNVEASTRRLWNLIEVGKAKASFFVTQELSLRESPEAYRYSDTRENGWGKALLTPAA